MKSEAAHLASNVYILWCMEKNGLKPFQDLSEAFKISELNWFRGKQDLCGKTKKPYYFI